MENEPDKQIRFSPADRGIGFHPFSDGLPYSPAAHKKKVIPRYGPAAVAIHPHKQPLPLRSNPGAITRKIAPLLARHYSVPSQKSTAIPPINPTVQPLLPPLRKKQLVGPFQVMLRRLVAATLDLIFTSGLSLSGLAAFLWMNHFSVSLLNEPGGSWLVLFLLIAIHWCLLTLQEVALKSSFGKFAMRLRLKGDALSILTRALLFIPGFLALGLGIFWALFNKDRRCLHDILSGLAPVPTEEL